MAGTFGFRYFAAKQFMPHHEVVAGRSWAQIEPGVQAIILGAFKIVGGGFVTYGLTLLWLLIPLSAKQPWAAWAVLTVTLTAVPPVLYVTATVRRLAPSARTPIIPAAIVLALAVSGASVSLFL
jgi:hypothetical protein